MSIVSVETLRASGPGASFVEVGDDVVQRYIDAAEGKFASYFDGRGYPDSLNTAGPEFEIAVIAVATWNALTLHRGMAPAGASQETLRLAYIDAMDWIKDVAKGKANLGPGVGPSRRPTGIAEVIESDPDDDNGRGWGWGW